ncbi:HNH endonuclease [Phenylobacterium terrae]|uniref:HNH endonuclease n=1 Tax=Phenylobacterium terrae TaxID=2665495 RepID=A0ABW4N6Q2_9CAUL
MGLTHEHVRELLDYFPDTGEFRWKKIPHPATGMQRRHNTMRAGKIAGGKHNAVGCIVRIEGRYYPAGRLAFFWMTGRWPRSMIRHRNFNASDNRWDNLVEATPSQISRAARPHHDGSSRFKGVYLRKNGYIWTSQITLNGEVHFIGNFPDEETAARAYDVEARKHFGEDAFLNFGDEGSAQ